MTSRHFEPARVGVLLWNSSLRLVHYNAEAASILSYPRALGEPTSGEPFLPTSGAQLASLSELALPPTLEIRSGRRRYLCRSFVLDSTRIRDGHFQPTTMVMLERPVMQALDITQWGKEFQLTSRERETVKLLLKGLTSKEIAVVMKVSPNTVKSFLKLVMAKVGAANRTAIVGKIVERSS